MYTPVYTCMYTYVIWCTCMVLYPLLGLLELDPRAITRTLLCCVVPFVSLRGYIPVLRL